MSRRPLSPSSSTWLALAITILGASVASAQIATTNTWIATTSGNWSDAGASPTNWSPAGPPTSAATTALQFNASGTTSYTATNDIVDPFALQGLYFNSTSSQPITIAGNVSGTLSGGIAFQNTSAPGYLLQNNTGAVNITAGVQTNNPGITGDDLIVGGTGSGTVNISGQISGGGGLAFNNAGGATFLISNPNNSNTIGASGLIRALDIDIPNGGVTITTNNDFIDPTVGAGMRITVGTLNLSPSGSGNNVVIHLNQGTSTTNGEFVCNGGGDLVLNKGTNTSLTAEINVLLRTVSVSSSGALVLTPSAGIAGFGTTESFGIYNTAFPQANVNSMVEPVIIAQNSGTDTSGWFTNYNGGTNGAVAANFGQYTTYTNYTGGGNFGTSTANTEVSNVTGATTVAAASTVYALRVTSSTLTINSGITLTLGGGDYGGTPGTATGYNQSGLILNNATITGGTLAVTAATNASFGGNELDVYTSAGTSTIASVLNITNNGSVTPALVVFGPGKLLLTNAGNTIGTTAANITIDDGTLAINGPGGTNDATALGTGLRNIFVRGGGTFEVQNGNYTPAAGTKQFVIVSAGATFKVDDTSVLTFAQTNQLQFVANGVVLNGPLNKTGTGTLAIGSSTVGYALSGVAGVYANGGTLLMNGAMTVSTPYFVNNSGTLGGTGSIQGNVTVRSGGTISPGAFGTVSAFGITGAVFMPGGIYGFGYNPATTTPVAGTDNGTLSSSGGTLDLTNLSATNKFTVNLFAAGLGNPVSTPVTYDAGVFSSLLLPTSLSPPTAGENLTSLFTFTGTYNHSTTPTVTVDASNVNQLDFTFTPASLSALSWTGTTNGNWSVGTNWSGGTAPTSSLNLQLSFGSGAVTTAMTNDIGTVTLNSMTFTAGAPVYSLASGTLNFVTNANGGLPQLVSNSSNTVTISSAITLGNNLTVSGSGTGLVTLSGPISGSSSLTVSGTSPVTISGLVSGGVSLVMSSFGNTLSLTNTSNSFTGGVNVNAGTVAIPADSVLGTGPLTIGVLGTLAYTATTSTTRSFTLNGGTLAVNSGVTLTLNGGSVSGGTMDGSGTFATNATNGALFDSVTATPSVSITSNSAKDQYVRFTNSATLTFAGGLNPSVSTAISNLNSFTNEGLGSVTIGAGSAINAANFQTYGTLTLVPNTTAAPTVFTNTGNSPLGFDAGSRTFIGTSATADPTGQNIVDYIDLHGQNAIVAGGIFVNNGGVYDTVGAGTHTIIADYGALVKGAGFYQNTVKTQNGGKFQTGNSPGSATFGTFVFSGPAGNQGVSNYQWQIDDPGPSPSFPSAPGVAGGTSAQTGQPDFGWSINKAVHSGPSPGNFNFDATPTDKLTVVLQTLTGSTTVGNDILGNMQNFDPNHAYSWPLVSWQGTYTGPTTDALLDADTIFDTSSGPFANATAPGSTFGWHLDTTNNQLDLIYTPLPEPGTLALTGLAGLAAGWVARRRRAKGAAATQTAA